MTTIVETMKDISEIIEETFTESIKLVLRKTIRPTLNPSGPNARAVFNPFTGRFERGFVGNDPSDSVNKYTYRMTTDALGWTDDNVTTFRITPKAAPSQTVQPKLQTTPIVRFPTSSMQIPLSNGPGSRMSFQRLVECITTKSASSVISNRKGASYPVDMTYAESFKQLNLIGQDIINQTDESISPESSARMSTAMLRARLFNLENILTFLLVTFPDIYPSYVDMVRLINSQNSTNTIAIITLIGTLAVVSWNDLSPDQQECFINRLGQNFINDFNSNELIAILLKTNVPELILTTSLLYSLLKMLYIVFGYNELIPNLLNPNNSDYAILSDNIQRYHNKNQGAFLRRPSASSPIVQNIPRECIPRSCRIPCQPDCVPPSECTYDFIKLFCALYPEITKLMGGCIFPEPCQNIKCGEIPPSYIGLLIIPEFLLRFTLFSHCVYLDFKNSRQVSNALGSGIDNRVRYLKTF